MPGKIAIFEFHKSYETKSFILNCFHKTFLKKLVTKVQNIVEQTFLF